MIQFTSLGPDSCKITGGEKPVIVFPEAAKADQNMITLLPVPEESTTVGALSWPGEYNEAGISIRGIGHAEGQQVSYVLEMDGVRIGVLSSPLKDWSDKQVEGAPNIDVLVIPAGDPKVVQKLVDEFDPRVLILLPGTDKNALAAVEKGIGVKERVGEYKLKGSLPAEGREVIVLA